MARATKIKGFDFPQLTLFEVKKANEFEKAAAWVNQYIEFVKNIDVLKFWDKYECCGYFDFSFGNLGWHLWSDDLYSFYIAHRKEGDGKLLFELSSSELDFNETKKEIINKLKSTFKNRATLMQIEECLKLYTCNVNCDPSDYVEGGKCHKNGCFDSETDKLPF